jgi:polypeptide N-acetylgalactosaminyltransferase
MFRTKIRIHTCKVVLFTSLVWFLVDVMVLMYYTECVGSRFEAIFIVLFECM